MKVYKNLVSGMEIRTDCVLSGGDWVLMDGSEPVRVEEKPAEAVLEEKETLKTPEAIDTPKVQPKKVEPATKTVKRTVKPKKKAAKK